MILRDRPRSGMDPEPPMSSFHRDLLSLRNECRLPPRLPAARLHAKLVPLSRLPQIPFWVGELSSALQPARPCAGLSFRGHASCQSGHVVTLTHACIPWPTVGSIDVRRARTDVDSNSFASDAFIVAPWRFRSPQAARLPDLFHARCGRVEVHNRISVA